MLDEASIILDVTPGEAVFETKLLEGLGHPVLVCHGPDWGKACPILGGTCAKLDHAHGVVFQLDLDRPQHRVILRRYQELLPDDVPIWAAVRPGQDETYADLLRGVYVVVGEPSAADLDALAAQVEAGDMTR
jgi:hypothetical protein